MTRPLFNQTVQDLDHLAHQDWDDVEKLEGIVSELRHRSTNAAIGLKSRLSSRIESLQSPDHSSTAPEIPDQVKGWTNEAVAKLRSKLIDLSRRSPLVAFKHGSRSASMLRIVDERPDLLFGALTGGSMGFDPLPGEDETPPDEKTAEFRIAFENAQLTDDIYLQDTDGLGDDEADMRAWQKAERALKARVRQQLNLPPLDYGKAIDIRSIALAHGFDPSFDLKSSDDELCDHHQDDKIRVLLTESLLNKRLKSIWDRAKSHLRETGHHTLFLVFGFVQWFEDDTSDITQHAPLLLLPVALDREVKRGRYDYSLRALEDGMEVNVSLLEKAREHWGLEFPELRADETPESYFVRAAKIAELGQRLKIRKFATLAVLKPMVLWKDLDPDRWDDDAFAAHRLLPGLIGATEMQGSETTSEEIDIDDPKNEAAVPPLITDADASQHGAIMDMAAGNDLAIEGPPGTGKSQTITNMIAAALSKGKKVLFVAEKQAALRVVSERLRAAGFGPLLLELHGERANRSDVYEGVRERLDAGGALNAKHLNAKRKALYRHRDLLRRYLLLIRQNLGAIDKTAFELAWREIKLKAQFDPRQTREMSEAWEGSGVATLTPNELDENRKALDQFGRAQLALHAQDKPSANTHWIVADRLNPFDQSPELQAAEDAAASADRLVDAVASIENLGFSIPGPEAELDKIVRQLNQLKPFSCQDEDTAISALHFAQSTEDILEVQQSWMKSLEELTPNFADPRKVHAAQISELRDAFAIQKCPVNLASLNDEILAYEDLRATLAKSEDDIRAMLDRTQLGSDHSIASMASISNVFANVSALSDNAQALLSSDLLSPTVKLVIEKSKVEAERLKSERSALADIFSKEAFDCEPSDLDELALTLSETGLIGRVLGSQYRTANRRARRWLADEIERLELSEQLGRLSRLIREIASFRTADNTKALLPDILWDGPDSDYEALQAARHFVVDAHGKLEAESEADMMRHWLGLDHLAKSSCVTQAIRTEELLARANSLGLEPESMRDLSAQIEARLNELGRLKRAIADLGAHADCVFEVDQRPIYEVFELLLEAQTKFNTLAEAPNFAWISSIDQSLAALRKTVVETKALGEIPGPISIINALYHAREPGKTLQDLIDLAKPLEDATSDWLTSERTLREITGVQAPTMLGADSWLNLATALKDMANDKAGIALVADMLKYRKALEKGGLEAFAEASVSGKVSPSSLADIYELLVTSALLRSYLGGDGQELGELGSLSLDDARTSFKKVDRELHRLEASAVVSARLKDQAPWGIGHGPKRDYTDMALLEHEVNLKRPRTSMRDVVSRAGAALQIIKPVWMMSPSSVAQYIRPGSLKFDLLIVDEASQMRPEFSVSSIMRADQFVVVGDANQLPPSDHFQIGSASEDDDGVGIDDNTESILDLANQKFRHKRRLRWHYRSQHESLIQFSNREFYEKDLVVFPSPSGNEDELLGVKCIHVPSIHDDTVYDASINQREAETIIEHAFGLMQSHPERSIGIVAMNAKQTELIKNEFDRLVLEEERVRDYVQSFEGTVDEFFIKNLENVQGDERDIILISTVYGPNKDGVVRQNFGLMNREVGWRRLNVLVTRAKISCRLITSLRPNDIKITENSSKGVLAFRNYLTYAHGGATVDDGTGGEPDSDFEIFVADALRSAGYEVVYQVGVAGFKIDLGVRHSEYPAGFIAGIECDGATYHSGLTVRDRDYIRQTVLEGLGWNIYRVWSTDWFQDAARETIKMIAWLNDHKERLIRELPSSAPQSPVDSKASKQETEVGMPDIGQATQVAAILPNAQQTFEYEANSASKPESQEAREPRGREMRKLGDFEWYEAIRGRLYEVWLGELFAGEVEVTKRASASPKLYGDHVLAARSEYEGRMSLTGDIFISYDVYAAVKEVAARALEDEANIPRG